MSKSKADSLLILRSRLLVDLIDERVRGEYMIVDISGDAQLSCYYPRISLTHRPH